MRYFLKKSTSTFLLLGAFLFVPHMGECTEIQDGIYTSKENGLDALPKTLIEVHGNEVTGHFHKGGVKVGFSGTINKGTATVTHQCGPCPKDVSDKSKIEVSQSLNGNVVAKSSWIKPTTDQQAQTTENLTLQQKILKEIIL